MESRKTVFALYLLVIAGLLLSAPLRAVANEKSAKSILKEMSDYVGSQRDIKLSFDSDIEIITPQLEKIQFTNSGEAVLHRPNRLRAHRHGGYADVMMYFDGNTVSIHGQHNNSYAQFAAPGSVDDLIHALREGHGVAMPGSDLLLSNSYEVLVPGILEAKYIGRGVIGGVECEHLAFRNMDTDWQLWVQVGKRPIPRKMVVTSKTMNSAPQYTVTIKQWETDAQPGAGAFLFSPPGDATRIKETELIEFDELPPGATGGDSQ